MPPKSKGETPGPGENPSPQPIDYEKLVNDVAGKVMQSLPPAPPAPNFDELVEKIETRLAVKYLGAVDDMKVGLDKQLVDLTNSSAERTFNANAQGLMQAINKQVETKLSAFQGSKEPAPGQPTGEAAVGRPAAGFDFSSLVNAILPYADKIGELVKLFRPAPPADQVVFGQISNILRWHSILAKYEKSGGNIDEFAKAAGEFTKTT